MGQPAENLCSVSIDERRHDRGKEPPERTINYGPLHRALVPTSCVSETVTGEHREIAVGKDLLDDYLDLSQVEALKLFAAVEKGDHTEIGRIVIQALQRELTGLVKSNAGYDPKGHEHIEFIWP